MPRIYGIGELDWRTFGATEHRFGREPENLGGFSPEVKWHVDFLRSIFAIQSIERRGDSRCTLLMTLLLDAVHRGCFHGEEFVGYGEDGGMCIRFGPPTNEDYPFKEGPEWEALLDRPNSLHRAFSRLAVHLETTVLADWSQPDYMEIEIHDYTQRPVVDAREFIEYVAQKLSEFVGDAIAGIEKHSLDEE
jgi:hypothetical protein